MASREARKRKGVGENSSSADPYNHPQAYAEAGTESTPHLRATLT